MTLLLILQLWSSYITSHDRAVGRLPEVKFWGNWQSCLDENNDYGERIFPYEVSGVVRWSLHLGPYDEFALYRGQGPKDRDTEGALHSHDDQANLLGTGYHYNAFTSKTGRNWTIPSLHLRVNVIEAGGSRSECESFTIKVEEMRP